MAMFLSTTVKAILLGLIAVAFGLNRLARAYPSVGWLQVFRLPERHMSEEEKAWRKRAENRRAGLEIILAGFGLPLVYFGLGMVFFTEPSTLEIVVIGLLSVLFIGGGVWLLARNF
ncbi:MAG TPA: hypothetical protein VE969_08900 [Pyrinomonadaceae bacterium]|jgi:hypothetical protein|nr:hypothetical protein [Pyrinomonadaceae bacterium]